MYASNLDLNNSLYFSHLGKSENLFEEAMASEALNVPQSPSAEYDSSKVKITVIGDAEVGKSCLLMGYRPNNSSLVPSIFNSITIQKSVLINTKTNEQRDLNIELCDTGPDEQYKQLRVMKSYKNVDIILFCFDINNINSLQNIASFWLPEVEQFAPKNIIKLLIGLKADLRTNQSIISQNTLISMDEISEFRESHSDVFMDYVEISALKKIRINEGFEIGIQHFFALEHKHRKSTAMKYDDNYDEDPSDLVGTHTKQWNDYLRDQGGSVFSQYTNTSNQSYHPQQHQPSMALSTAAMSYQSGQYNMGSTLSMASSQQHQPSIASMNGHGNMSYTHSNGYLGAQSYQSNMSGMGGQSLMSNGMGGGGGGIRGGGGGTLLGNVDEDEEMDIPPPPATSPKESKPKESKKPKSPKSPKSMSEQSIGLKDNDGINNHKLSISGERNQSIDYGYDGKNQSSGSCCIIL